MNIRHLLFYVALPLILSACGSPKKIASLPTTPTTPTTPVTPNTPKVPETPIVSPPQNKALLKKDYEGFTVWLDCKERAPVKFQYTAKKDTGNEPRQENFTFDPDVPKDCQQTSTKAYGSNYDRGHQVPANHVDYSAVAIKQSNYMTNILPQTSVMNRGAWLLTEEIIECYRDIDTLQVFGGVIWGNNTENDLFVTSHGVRTPDAFWKVVVRSNKDAIAWIVPNDTNAKRDNLNQYLVSVADVEKTIGEKISVSVNARTTKLTTSWLVPVGCNKN